MGGVPESPKYLLAVNVIYSFNEGYINNVITIGRKVTGSEVHGYIPERQVCIMQ